MEKHSSSLNNNGSKVKLLCSYGGKIQSRPTDHQLSYVGGDTKILAVDRNVNFSEIAAKLNSLCNMKERLDLSIKYQLPGEDLDALVSLIDDEDVEHMMVEYERMQRISPKPARLRLFIFDISAPPVKSGVKDSGPNTPSNPDYLFGFDKEYQPNIGPPLDLLQIPGIILPENYGFIPYAGVEGKIGITESYVSGGVNNVIGSGAAAQVVYRVPAVVNGGGVYRTGPYAYGVMPETVNGNREQPLYNIVPVMPSMPEQRMVVSTGNGLEVKGNQRKF
ncbi:hypothetical protein PHJA_001288600 [Phtheirospermum japonicum]|uniref:PB1 domain-containing protein n=1 Tax=Phtheirospermum japonicum TaxID=374723 RepID=A0A830BXE8_9LAMI|nr:hypothetical protein PHJA_001288600 [Phtheirospermum japonicum]